MKKNYLKPEVFSLNFVSQSIMIDTSGNTTVGGGSAGSGNPDEVRGNRGEWGNVWGK